MKRTRSAAKTSDTRRSGATARAVKPAGKARRRTVSLTVRGLDPAVKSRLRVRAAEHGVSMEEEARRILLRDLAAIEPLPDNLADGIAALFDPLGGVDLDLPPRVPSREPPRFDDE